MSLISTFTLPRVFFVHSTHPLLLKYKTWTVLTFEKKANAINAKYIDKRYTKHDARGALCCVDWAPAGAALQAKGSFMRQRVNTGWMGLRHCSFSRWAITPTTLVPKTRLNGVSVRLFTPLCECPLWSGSTVGCVFGGRRRGVTEGLFVTDRVGRGPSYGLHAKTSAV